ncbi:MAG: efflux RND transporter permease subunit, partial [Clostridiaceae bacterium]
HPFTIMLSVPLAFSGGALGLFLTGKALSVPAFIGVIMLAGIVVNNAIVLVDYINIRRNHGEERNEAIVNAGPIRLRPILMTTLTTVLGLVPLALGIGEGAEAQAPMAIVVIGGLMLSTLLTLVFIPVVYTLFDDLTNKFKRKVIKNSKTVEEV